MQGILTPGEDDEMHVFATTQNPNKTQEYVARVLGIGAHKVVCTVKRMGGGFGGKETRCMHIIAAASVAARATRRPVRFVLDRDTDMCITGQRHAFLGRYKVGFLPNGKIVAADVDLYANAGCRCVSYASLVCCGQRSARLRNGLTDFIFFFAFLFCLFVLCVQCRFEHARGGSRRDARG